MNGDTDTLEAGSVAPDFMLTDQDGANHALSDFLGQWVLLCFYAHDSVAKCAKEILLFRDHFEKFKQLGIAILGISADTKENHKEFAEKNRIPFPLLSDITRKVAKQYHALAREQFFDDHDNISQISYLVNLAGEIEKAYPRIRPDQHAGEVLTDFAKMQKEDDEDKESIRI